MWERCNLCGEDIYPEDDRYVAKSLGDDRMYHEDCAPEDAVESGELYLVAAPGD